MANEEYPIHRLRPICPDEDGPDKMLSIRLRVPDVPQVLDVESTVVTPRKSTIGRKWPRIVQWILAKFGRPPSGH